MDAQWDVRETVIGAVLAGGTLVVDQPLDVGGLFAVEGRLMAMLEGVDDLTLARLNEATQAWVEYDYNRKHHSEIDDTPLARFLAGPDVTRPCPDAAALRLAFTRTERRTLRKSDGTAVIEGRRFEVPSRYRHLASMLRYPRRTRRWMRCCPGYARPA
jgi:hypothetical protein